MLMKTLEFYKKILGDNEKLKNNLKCHGWAMGHGWGSHGGTSQPKHNSRNITCFGGICFGGSNCPGIKTHIGLPIET
jgi:hypothetical protein